MEVAATIADLKGKSSIITRITTTMETNRSRTNELTESSTTLGWCNPLNGHAFRKLFLKAASTLSTSFPYCTILLPSRISMEG